MVGQLLGTREGVAHHTGNALSRGLVETFKVSGFPSSLGDSFVPSRWDDALIGVILIRMEPGLCTVPSRDLGPQLFGTVAAAISDGKRHDLTGAGVHRDPHPWLVGFLLHEAPHLIGFGFQPKKHHVGWTPREPNISMIRTGRKALDHEVQEPCKTDTYSPADPAERDALAP